MDPWWRIYHRLEDFVFTLCCWVAPRKYDRWERWDGVGRIELPLGRICEYLHNHRRIQSAHSSTRDSSPAKPSKASRAHQMQACWTSALPWSGSKRTFICLVVTHPESPSSANRQAVEVSHTRSLPTVAKSQSPSNRPSFRAQDICHHRATKFKSVCMGSSWLQLRSPIWPKRASCPRNR